MADNTVTVAHRNMHQSIKTIKAKIMTIEVNVLTRILSSLRDLPASQLHVKCTLQIFIQ